jgi:hypothetical protein
MGSARPCYIGSKCANGCTGNTSDECATRHARGNPANNCTTRAADQRSADAVEAMGR